MFTFTGFKESQNSFLFSLINNDNLAAFKSVIQSNQAKQAIYSDPDVGPTFGEGNDFKIWRDGNTGIPCGSTNFGYTYQLPSGYQMGEDAARLLLAGNEEFTPTELEVFYLKYDHNGDA